MNEFIAQFLVECRELVTQATDDLLALEEQGDDRERLDSAFRAFHTLKGAAGIVDFDAMGRLLPAAPPNFQRLGAQTLGEPAALHTLRLRFAVTTKLTGIASGNEFRAELGGSCVEGDVYQAGSTCAMLVRFTPHGAGRRLGHVSVSHTASATPLVIGLNGSGYAPVLSFTPAQITTVAGTFTSSKGLLSGAKSLAVDGGDTLYVADTGNNVVRMMDSSGNFATISTGAVAPWGVAADSFGDVWYSEESSNRMIEIPANGTQSTASGAGTDTCNVTTPCVLSKEAIESPGQISINANDTMFFAEAGQGAALSQIQPTPATLVRLLDPFTYTETAPATFSADANSILYTAWTTAGACQINAQILYNAEYSIETWSKVAGGRTCGFSGDGGQSRNAEIGKALGQFAFDAAGNMYISDTGNQRVRRIDASTSIISTIAGNGTAGYYGDSGPATEAELDNPTGVAVDSEGQVYIVSGAASGQVIRKVGPNGYVNFEGQTKGLPSATRVVTVANTGNATEVLNSLVIDGADAKDFAIDPDSTTCNLPSASTTSPVTLANGESCKLGVKFTPAAAGLRSARIVFLDNTINGMDTIDVVGTGELATSTVDIDSPARGESSSSSETIVFKVTVNGLAGLPAPTGSVQFKVDGAEKGSPVALSSDEASIDVAGLAAGTHKLSATYLGNGNYAASSPVILSITVTSGTARPVARPAPIIGPVMRLR